MGSFNQTCCISGLPITEGDEIRFFLLTENPYTDSLVCSPQDLYFPRTYPLKAVYNHYGSIEDYDPDSPEVFGILEGFKRDLVEVGTGDNSAHDVPTNRAMDFAKVLDAIWEGRVLVKRNYDSYAERDKTEALRLEKLLSSVEDKSSDLQQLLQDTRDKLTKGETKEECIAWKPSLQSVSKILIDAGYEIDNVAGALLVDEQGDGWVRVRTGGYDQDARLDDVLVVLQKHYAAMLTAGSGNYSRRQEIHIMPSPGFRDEHRVFLQKDDNKPLRVFQGMILEEVWQGLIGFDKKYQTRRQELAEKWSKADESRKKFDAAVEKEPLGDDLGDILDREEFSRSLPRSPLYDLIPFSMSLEQHHNFITDRHREEPFTETQVSDYIDNVAGFVSLLTLYGTSFHWQPSFSFGPQFANYGLITDWQELLTIISQQLSTKHRCGDENDEEDGCEEDN